MKNITQSLKLIILALALSIGISYVSAWTAPTATPPSSNVAAPINVGSTAQTKTGDICTTSGGTTKCLSSAGDNLGNHTATQALNMGTNNITAGGANSTYGAMTIQGSKNTYGGINFKDAGGSNSGTLMMNPGYSGFFNAGDNNWRMYVTDGGASMGNVYASDYYSYSAGKWMSQIAAAGGVPSGTLCGSFVNDTMWGTGWGAFAQCQGLNGWSGCPAGYTFRVTSYDQYSGAANYFYSCVKN